MSLPTSYMTGSFTKIPQYFETMLTAKAPDKFTTKFMADLGFTSSNDRQFVNVLKAIGFLDDAGTPTERYFKFLDQSFSKDRLSIQVQHSYEKNFLSTSKGVRKFKRFLGRLFISSTMFCKSSSEMSAKEVPFGKNCRSRPLVFSFVPRCHGE